MPSGSTRRAGRKTEPGPAKRTALPRSAATIAAICSTGLVVYKASKAGVNALTQALVMGNAKYGIHVNAIMPGLIKTPMAIEAISQMRGISKAELIGQCDAPPPSGREDGKCLGCGLRSALAGIG